MPEGRNEEERVATPTSFSIFDSYGMKSLGFELHYDIFTGLKIPISFHETAEKQTSQL